MASRDTRALEGREGAGRPDRHREGRGGDLGGGLYALDVSGEAGGGLVVRRAQLVPVVLELRIISNLELRIISNVSRIELRIN